MKTLSLDDLRNLALDFKNIEKFGPNTKNPYLVFQLDTELPKPVADFMNTVPCPVIGIGQSVLEANCDVSLPNTSGLSCICRNIEKAPYAAMVLVQHLRASEHQTFEDALLAESLAYGVVQNGPEFKKWLETSSEEYRRVEENTPVSVNTEQDSLRIILTDPANNNAISKEVRDALCDALDLGLLDKTLEKIVISGSGRTFSTGGDIAEFGSISDATTAHWIRSLRQPATRLARLRNKLHVHVNGAAIGAGAEMAAFGHYVTATPNAWFQLPELKYGLIPGAGGTVSLSRRIGRQKTAYMALSMERIRAQKALDWGLIDDIIEAPNDI